VGRSVVKVSFDTTLQNNVTLQARQANGLPLPFAATIYNPPGKRSAWWARAA
jgi:outer membrane usher protein